jgi:hypothetical protein
MGAVARCSLAATLAIAAATAQAQPIQWSTGRVLIEFDPSTSSFFSDTVYMGPQEVTPVISTVSNGVRLHFGGTLAAFASSYQYFTPDSRQGTFNAFIGFTPESGYAITGYTVTYTGGYFVESPASVGLNGQSGTVVLNGNAGGDSFSIDAYHGGSTAPQISGELSAWADINYIEVLDHYEQVYSHDEQVLDYCETEEPFTCYYRTEPVYTEQPVYRYESDLGEGQIYLTSIDVQAHVVAVPEPESLALGLAGLMVAGSRLRNRQA